MSMVSDKDVERTAYLFHSLADETRLRIVDCLLEGDQCVCDLTDLLRMGQSRLSFHLKTLKDSGLLKDRREGRWIYYSLNRDALEELENMLKDLKAKTRAPFSSSRRCD